MHLFNYIRGLPVFYTSFTSDLTVPEQTNHLVYAGYKLRERFLTPYQGISTIHVRLS